MTKQNDAKRPYRKPKVEKIGNMVHTTKKSVGPTDQGNARKNSGT